MEAQATATPVPPPAAEAPTVIRTLEDLAGMAPGALMEAYRGGRVPGVRDLDGALAGRMLAIPLLARLPLVPRLLRAYGRSRIFPWQGKTFRSLDADRGEGVNRVLWDRFSWFRFTTGVGKSRSGDFDALLLDYDHPSNPPLVRSVKDEVREVAPGLWLGQAFLCLRSTPRLVLFFGLERKRDA